MVDLTRVFGRARIDDRLVNELVGLARGILADGKVDQAEAEYLEKWLIANGGVAGNPIIATLLARIEVMLKDGLLDATESQELFDSLSSFVGGDFEAGELLKSTSLPFDDPAPLVDVVGSRFCFTGTFAFGTRRICENEVVDRGATAGILTSKTDYLVVGIYATDTWAHSSYGRKIESAVAFRDKGKKVAIIGEAHWLESLEL
ncbi:MAG: BRCT domain-containing protein [Candidatus Reddybacter sp.]